MCRAGGGGREDGVASAGAEGCWVGESCQREVIQAGNDVRSPPSAWPRLVSTGQRGVFAIKWTALLVHKTPILRVILAQFTVQSLRTSYVSPGSMTERLWLHPAEVPFSTVVLRESALLGDCCRRVVQSSD